MLYFDFGIFSVIIAAIAGFVVGVIWYSDFAFGKIWRAWTMKGVEDLATTKKEMQKKAPLALLSNFVFAYVLAIFLSAMVPIFLSQAIVIGALVWLGFITTFYFGSVLWEKTPVKVFLLNSAHNFVMIEIMVVILFFLM